MQRPFTWVRVLLQVPFTEGRTPGLWERYASGSKIKTLSWGLLGWWRRAIEHFPWELTQSYRMN